MCTIKNNKNKHMKKIITVFAFLLFGKLAAVAGEPNVLGVWLVGDKDYKIELYKNAAGELEGKVVWMKEPNDKNGKPRTDVDNPDEKLRTQPVMGLKTVTKFKWNETEGKYTEGKVYKKGKTYCGKITLNPDGTLGLRGFLCSMSFIGKSDTWTRVK